jgi:hypothetical protein
VESGVSVERAANIVTELFPIGCCFDRVCFEPPLLHESSPGETRAKAQSTPRKATNVGGGEL